MERLLIAALVCSAVSYTMTTTAIFQWWRDIASLAGSWAEQLVHCPWCLSHYVVAVFLLTSDFPLWEVSGSAVYNFICTLFAIVGIGAVIQYVLLRAFEPVQKALQQRALRKEFKS